MPAAPPIRVLLTGATRRIGRSIALAFAARGAHVAVTYREPHHAQALHTSGELRAAGALSAHAIPCELTDPAGITSAVHQAAQVLGGLSVVVNNAGIFQTAPLEQLTLAQWDETFAVNTRAPFLVSQTALPFLQAHAAQHPAHPARIVHLGSLGGQRPWATHAHYCASKAALHMLTAAMAKAWAPAVTVNCVAPGMIAAEPLDDAPGRAARTPLGRNGTPGEIAEAVLYFATAATFVTGQVLLVDGGLGL